MSKFEFPKKVLEKISTHLTPYEETYFSLLFVKKWKTPTSCSVKSLSSKSVKYIFIKLI